jgi:hypothetical protein
MLQGKVTIFEKKNYIRGEYAMNVHGFQIASEIIAASILRMKQGPFTAANLTELAKEHGVPQEAGRNQNPADRFADRVIQRERKAGNIRFNGRVWSWVALLDTEDAA